MSELRLNLEHAAADRAELTRRAASLRDALSALDVGPGGEFMRVTARRDLLREIRSWVRDRSASATDVVQLGIGGSSLGGQALCAALLPPRHNERARRPTLRFHFPDNVDPDGFGALLEQLDPGRTLVHVVSKSGGTLETAAQLWALLHAFERSGKRFNPRRNIVVTTGPKGLLREFAEEEGIPILTFPDDVAGRYSVFTASGLLVPALCGVPINRVLAGARQMEERCRNDVVVGPAGRLAALHFAHDQLHGRVIHVDLIYSDALHLTGEWFAQLWAESLGKKGTGPTPVVARGATDQHSQLQLYIEGPDDKLYTFLRVERARTNVRIGRRARPDVIAGRSLASVFDAEARGTEYSLVESGRPVIEIRLPRLTPETLGQLLMMRLLQTALAGALYRVDPFVQPGVEAGKLAALRVLSSGSPSA